MIKPIIFDEVLTIVKNKRRLTKLQFINLLGDEVYIAILSASKSSIEMEAWVRKFDAATPDLDGTSIDLDNQDTINGLNQLLAINLIDQDKYDEILNYGL